MPVMQNSYIQNAGLLGRTRTANLIDAAQNGVGVHLPSLDGAMPATWGPAVVVVTHVPRVFTLIKNGESIFKALIERHAKTIDGIDFGYTLESNPHQIGHDKQELFIRTNATRTPVAPNITYDELNDNLIWNFHRTWQWLIRDPDTQTSGVAILNGSDEVDITLLSSFAADLCVIQFDGTGMPENIIDAFFLTGFWPEETGLIGVKREIGVVETQTRSVPYKAILQHNDRTRSAGIEIASVLQLHRANYVLATPVATEIESRINDLGINKEIEEIAADFR